MARHARPALDHVSGRAHHNLDSYLEAYVSAADIAADRKGPLFRTLKGRTGQLTRNPLLQQDVHRMIRQRAAAAGIKTEIGCHTFRATGITAYLKNGGKLEMAHLNVYLQLLPSARQC